MGAGIFVFQSFHILLDRGTAIKDASLDVGHVLAEPVVFVTDLVCELAGMAHDKDRNFTIYRFHLLQCSKHKYGSFSESGLRLANDITTE